MKRSKLILERIDLYFLILLIFGIVIYLSRIDLGFVGKDESFYLTIPYRLVQGDSLLTNEWHVSQLAGFLLYPVMKLYLSVFGKTDGIYLAFRYIYLFFLIMTTLLSYVLLKRRDKNTAVISCIVFFFFTPFYIKALSYNSMGLMAVWLFVAVLLTETRFFRIKHIISGILLSAIVLCNPYVLIAYALYSLICFWKRERSDFFGIQAWIWVTFGCSIMLLLFFLFVLQRTTIPEIIRNVRYVFWDPAHEGKNLSDFFRSIIWFIDWFKEYFVLVLISGIAGFFYPKWRRFVFICLTVLSIIWMLLLVVFKTSGIGKHAIMLPLTLLGGIAFAYTKNKSWDILKKGWLVGIIYAICMNLSSNQGIYVICNACTISSCVSLFLLKDFLKEDEEWGKRRYWFALLVIVQLLAETYELRNFVHEEENLTLLSYKITSGPLKGIYTTEEKRDEYFVNYENIMSMGNLEDKNIFFFNYFPCGYLIAEKARNAAFSAWIIEYRKLDDERISIYYDLHPDKIPEIIYIDTYAELDWADIELEKWCSENGYLVRTFPAGGKALFLK